MKRKVPYILALVTAGVVASLSVALAQIASGSNVVEVRVEGNEQMSEGAVLSYVQTRVGQGFDEFVARGDKQRLLKTRRFDQVDIAWEQKAEGVVVTITVKERPLVKKVAFVGNKAFKENELARELPFGVSDAMDSYRIEAGRQAIDTLYRSKGYSQVDVSIDAEALKSDEVIYRIVEGPQAIVRKLVFEGRRHFSKWKLGQTIGTSASFWPFVKGYLDTEQVERDVIAIRNLYLSEGFLDVQVGRRYDYSDDKTKVRLYFLIDEGPRYCINQFVFRGNTVYSDDELAGRIAELGGLQARKHYTALEMQRSIEAIRNTYGELGHIDVDVIARKQYLDPTGPMPDWAALMDGEKVGVLNVVFEIEERDQYSVGEIVIRGNDVTQARVIRRELRFYPEQLFNTVAVEESRRRLLETRLFDKVTITPTGKAPNVRDVLVQVSEAKTAEFLVGVGVSTNSGVLGNVSFTQRNFDLFGWPGPGRTIGSGRAFKGAGQTLRIVAEPGLELMRFHVDWFEPYLFDKPYSLGTKAFLFTRGRESYDETRYGGVVSVGHRFKNRWYGEIASRVEGVNIGALDSDAPVEVVEDEGTHGLVGIKGTLVKDRTDSRWMPSRGDRFRLSYEQLVASYNFGIANADYRIYRTLYVDALDRKHILAGRVAGGYIFGDSPVFERFYGGGIGSVRGFQYRGISPRGTSPAGLQDNDPIGGELMAFAGTEYTFPLIGQYLRGVVFLDSGTVEADFGVTTWRASAGAGVRWVVPMLGPVPISLDFAVPLSKDGEDDTQLINFSIGWTF